MSIMETSIGRPATRDEATVPADPADPAVVAPFRVDRVAGLSVAGVDLDALSVDLVCGSLAEVQEEIARLAPLVSELLYDLVPQLEEDVAARRMVLAVRRACGSGTRRPRLEATAAVAATVRSRVGDDAGDLVDQWSGALDRQEALTQQLLSDHAAEVERAQDVLRTLLGEPRLAAGISQASPWLGQSLPGADLRPGRRAARSVGGYVTRAARKTSPFSFLTTVTSTVDRSRGRGPGERVTVSLVHVCAWLDALAADAELLLAFDLEPLPTPGRDPAVAPVLTPEVSRRDGFVWREDRTTDLGGLGPVLAELQALGRRPAAAFLDAVGGADPVATVQRLMGVGILRVVAPWGYGDQDRLARLAEAVEALGTARALDVAATLRHIGAQVDALPGTLGPERADALLAVRAAADDALAAFRGGVPSVTGGTLEIHADARPEIAVPDLQDALAGELLLLGTAVRPLLFRSHAYDLVRDRFVLRFGRGGRCTDLIGFLSTVLEGEDAMAGLMRAASADHAAKGTRTPRSALPVGRSSAPPAVSVLYQVAADGLEAIHRGEFELVVNQFHAGLGSLVSRFDALDGGGIRDAVRAWSAQLYPGAHVVEFIASCGSNDMQSACEGTFPRLRWPTERPTASDPQGSLDLDELVLRHDAEHDVLELSDRDGAVVAPVYMGLVPAHLLGGAERVLSIITDPWVNGAGASLRRLPPLPPDGERVRTLPRRQTGRLVIRRASWTVRAADLPRPERAEPDALFFRRLNDWRRELGVPDHVFVRLQTTGHGFSADERKPVWLSFLSPHSVAQLLATLDASTRGLTFVEVAPDDTDLWVTDADGRPYVTEHLSHLRWARPATPHATGGTP